MNLFDLFVRIGVKDEASDYISGLAGKLGSGISTAASVATAAVGVAVSGIAALTAGAVKNYTEYEQLVGGVDTLFKESSQRVQEYAANAYQTAGMSANDYMSNVTSFSASLLQSLGEDTEAAAEHANRAMVSISDNANKMGTDMQTLVNTYQSLARGNYAMLDNLKLGYGGTKAELERLIATAATYTEEQKKLGVTVDASSMSFANIVNAIAVVQEHMGIAGTTAIEAATTIEGSTRMMFAAWQNLVTGIADGNANMEVLIGNFVDSVGIAFGNLIPVIENALNGAADLINQLLPQLFGALPQVVSDVLPKLAEAAVNVIQALVDGIVSNQAALVDSAFNVVMTLVDGIIQLLPEIINAGVQLVANLIIGLAQALPELIPAAVDMIMQITQTLVDNMPLLIDAALQLITGLADGLIQALPVLIEAAPEIISGFLVAVLEHIPDLMNTGIDLLVALVDGILQSIPVLAQAAIDLVAGFINGIVEAWPEVKQKMNDYFTSLIDMVKGILGIHSPSTVFSGIGGNVATGFGNGFGDIWETVKSNIVSKIQNLVDKVKEMAAQIQESLQEANAATADVMADGGTINSGLEAAQKRGKTLIGTTKDNTTNITNNYNITTPKLSAADIIRETRYTQNRAVMVR